MFYENEFEDYLIKYGRTKDFEDMQYLEIREGAYPLFMKLQYHHELIGL